MRNFLRIGVDDHLFGGFEVILGHSVVLIQGHVHVNKSFIRMPLPRLYVFFSFN